MNCKQRSAHLTRDNHSAIKDCRQGLALGVLVSLGGETFYNDAIILDFHTYCEVLRYGYLLKYFNKMLSVSMERNTAVQRQLLRVYRSSSS